MPSDHRCKLQRLLWGAVIKSCTSCWTMLQLQAVVGPQSQSMQNGHETCRISTQTNQVRMQGCCTRLYTEPCELCPSSTFPVAHACASSMPMLQDTHSVMPPLLHAAQQCSTLPNSLWTSEASQLWTWSKCVCLLRLHCGFAASSQGTHAGTKPCQLLQRLTHHRHCLQKTEHGRLLSAPQA